MEESKSSKKNKKRRAAAKKGEVAFEIVEDVSVRPVSATSAPPSVTEPSPIDPIGDLKRQIEEAKAAKDHVKAQELRHKMWVLQDTIALGKAGPGAPKVDLQDIIGTSAEPTSTSPQPRVAVSTDPTEKKLGRLRKKLQQVEALKERRDKGEKLETNQVKVVVDKGSSPSSGACVLICGEEDGTELQQITKIEGEGEILEEISILEKLLTGATI